MTKIHDKENGPKGLEALYKGAEPYISHDIGFVDAGSRQQGSGLGLIASYLQKLLSGLSYKDKAEEKVVSAPVVDSSEGEQELKSIAEILPKKIKEAEKCRRFYKQYSRFDSFPKLCNDFFHLNIFMKQLNEIVTGESAKKFLSGATLEAKDRKQLYRDLTERRREFTGGFTPTPNELRRRIWKNMKELKLGAPRLWKMQKVSSVNMRTKIAFPSQANRF